MPVGERRNLQPVSPRMSKARPIACGVGGLIGRSRDGNQSPPQRQIDFFRSYPLNSLL